MTELPPQLKNFGLGARTFSRKPIETGEGEDKSIWTDTPLEKMIKSAVGDFFN